MKYLLIFNSFLFIFMAACGAQDYKSETYSHNMNLIYGCRSSSDCSLSESELTKKFNYEMSTEVNYSWSCKGHPVRVGFTYLLANNKYGIKEIPFPHGSMNNKKIVIESFGKVKVKNIAPADFSDSILVNCNLQIQSVVSSPSQNTKNKWTNEKNRLNNALIDAKISQKGFEDLSLLLPAYDVFGILSANLESDLLKNQKLIDTLCKVGICQGSEEVENLLEKMVFSNSNTLTPEDKEIIYKIKITLENLPQRSTECQNGECELILTDYMTSDQIDILNSLADRKYQVADAKKQFEYFSKKIEENEDALNRLKAVASPHIKW